MPYGGPNAVMQNRTPHPLERLQSWLEGLGVNRATRRGIDTVASLTPPIAAYDTAQSLMKGNYGDAALSGMEFLPFGLAAGLAAKGAKKAKGVDVPYTKLKLPQEKIAEYDAGRVVEADPRYVPQKMISIEDMQGGYMTNLYGDRADIGNVTHIGGSKLPAPVALQGGHGYQRATGTGAWASHPTALKAMSNRVRDADGVPVYGVYVPMSGEATDFTANQLQLAMHGFDPKSLAKTDLEDFNKAMKAQDDSFPGLDHPEFHSWAAKTGNNRYNLMKEMAKGKWAKAGFPDVARARHAMNDPQLRDLPGGNEAMGGQSVALMNPEGTVRPSSEIPMPHDTYQADIDGWYAGGMPQDVKRSTLFSDWYEQRRLLGKPESADNKSFLSNSLLEEVDQQKVDRVMREIEGRSNSGGGVP